MVVPLSSKELQLVKSFRDRIKDIQLLEKQRGDLYIASWLRARDLDLTKAEEMFRASMEWRKVNDVDNILGWKIPELFEKEFPFQICGNDKEKSPVLIIPFGKWDVRKVIEMGESENYIKYVDYTRVKVLESADTTLDDFTQFNIIFDLKGYSFRQLTGHGCVDVALETVRRFEANFPERLKVGYIINAPKIFSILFALIKPLLSPVTLAKVRIFGGNVSKWKLTLLNNIPADQLPVAYGGTSITTFSLADLPSDSAASSGEVTDLIEVTVGAGEKLEVEYEVKHPNTKLSWRFKTEAFDIGFALKYQNDSEIIKYERIEASSIEQTGGVTCDKIGSYTFLFDNTYSLVRAKLLHYMITLDSAEESDEEG